MTYRIEIKFILQISIYWVLITTISDLNGQILNKSVVKTINLINERSVNSANLEFSPCYYGNKIAFVHAENIKNKKTDSGIDEPFFDLVYSELDESGRLKEKINFHKRINSDFHEGPMAYVESSSKLYFTRAGIEKKRVNGIDRDTSVRKIMIADMSFSPPQVNDFNLNSKYYSVCHPALYADGHIMILAADKPGGYGGMDLYACFFDGTQWTGMVNLGPNINSPFNEVFPSIVKDSFLVFSSDRPESTGGLDLFVSTIQGGLWSEAEKADAPLNSFYDDFGLIISPNGRSGYMTSNRPGGKGKDDIYSFNVLSSLFGSVDKENKVIVHFKIIDKLSFEPVQYAAVEARELLFTEGGIELENYETDIVKGSSPGNIIIKISPKTTSSGIFSQSDSKGLSSLELKEKFRYIINVTSNEHEPFTIFYAAKIFGDTINLVLEPQIDSLDEEDSIIEEMTEGEIHPAFDDNFSIYKGSRIVFDNLLYAYNSFEILPVTYQEFDKLVRLMQENPFMRIRLESHTDSRGNEEYNLLLSIKRSESAKAYLISKGISHDRIETVGKGESKIRNKCLNGVKCTEKEHQFNRRTEIVILEIE